MHVSVLLSARRRELVGSGRVELELADGSTAGIAFEQLAARVPALAPMRARIRCAVDSEYCDWGEALHDGCEVALIPPTAGG